MSGLEDVPCRVVVTVGTAVVHRQTDRAVLDDDDRALALLRELITIADQMSAAGDRS